MRLLYHYPICAFSRIVRFILLEKKLDFTYIHESPWSPTETLLSHNVFGTLPVFVDINKSVVSGISAITWYIEEIYPEPNLIGGEDCMCKTEVRRISDWFSFNFYNDVYFPIIHEKIIKRFKKDGEKTPNPSEIRKALAKLAVHLEYMEWLIDRRNWLGGQYFSIADIYAASFLSVFDYLGLLPFEKYEFVKNWYARIKSRPTFRNILSDVIPAIPPSKDYANLDF
ncbi:MAG: glutathione S-transferase family protein [Holosporales bacterium]|nr:glutathione S-transferase family protein [Holosporales bacterium]